MRALLVIDVQNGFCPGGNLPVPDGHLVVPVINRLMDEGPYDLVVASQDWHPANHGSFASQHPGQAPFSMGELCGKPQVLWPDHCVQATPDAEFHPDLNSDAFDYIQQKGENLAVDSYSAFRDNDHAAVTGLAGYLRAQQVTELDVCGLATDYCVKFSVLDAIDMLQDVKIRFIEDASRGIDPEGVRAAIAQMRKEGAVIVNSADILAD
ncbi:bifunctional nicotinamidase/pyrazinamidase [Rhizobium sp. SSA_523]|uniref:bifunctional nicotinamidase/pyrazinamidase n=1 Tax=Rhizobium sp. SSA_523 TaxID=2952477 RepID=UPI0020918146|nr:bifunctional nicotinamidase/pyrazinamidase [Rhizobium sp. SSA_523]MCO5730273.1 bifunctional nicotinamidase/pyrazinamidase [Rhizobium sp. SSA_523]WKC25328.1 bifunctional nicotinamidase/pyrazinamidase [Rhizobium sp. SSA_523]